MESPLLKSFYTVSEEKEVITAKINRRISVSEFRQLISEVKHIAIEKNKDKLLLDGSTVDFDNVRIAERHDIGLLAAEILKSDFRAVLVIKQEYINKHGENVAHNRGANVLVTHSHDEAFEWLLK